MYWIKEIDRGEKGGEMIEPASPEYFISGIVATSEHSFAPTGFVKVSKKEFNDPKNYKRVLLKKYKNANTTTEFK